MVLQYSCHAPYALKKSLFLRLKEQFYKYVMDANTRKTPTMPAHCSALTVTAF